MKFVFFLMVATLGQLAMASASLNLDKLKNEAVTKITAYYGQSVTTADGRFYFWDGVGSTDLPPLFDFTSVIYVVTPSIPLEIAGLKIGYRLRLHGDTQVILTEFLPEQQAILVRFPGSIMANFKPGVSLKEQENVAKVLTLSFPNIELNHLREIGVMLVSGHPLNVIAAARKLEQDSRVANVDVDGETYRAPFEFDAYKELPQQTGVINVDSLRSISQRYHDEGYDFAQWTSIPPHLQ